MKILDLHGITNLTPVRGTEEWYWASDYIHGDLYEAEELFHDGHPVQSNRLYLIHYPGGIVYEPVPPVAGQYLGYPAYDNGTLALLLVNFPENSIRILHFDPKAERTQQTALLPLSAAENCYNLILHTALLSLTRQPNDNTFQLIWPEEVCFPIEARETFLFRDGDKLYFSIWYEDPDYREETIVRSLSDGAILERFPGDVRIMPNGEKWLVR